MRPLTEMQAKVAALVGRGLNAKEVGVSLGIETSTVRTHVRAIALRIPNPDGLAEYRLVMLWAAHERWCEEHGIKKTA